MRYNDSNTKTNTCTDNSSLGGMLMPLKNAPVCSRCNKTRTTHSSGLCSHCRRRPPVRKICQFCGDYWTNHESGLCHRCRRDVPAYEKLEDAILFHKREVDVLELRKNGASFAAIAEAVGCSKSTAHETFRRALQMPVREIYQEEV